MLVPERSPVRAVIFDLDEALLARTAAWCYAIEQAVASVTGERVDARTLAEEYRRRPWRHALSVVLGDGSKIDRCEGLCVEMFQRSSMKKLLVHEGIGMGLDAVRGAFTEMGAISREPHSLALKQVQSTGLDRFLAVLSASPAEERWEPRGRFEACLEFLERTPGECVFIAPGVGELRDVAATGVRCFEAGWASDEPTGFPVIAEPGDVARLIYRLD